MPKKAYLLLVIVSFVLFLSGCATTPNIGYVSKSEKKQPKNVSVQIGRFEDIRPLSEKSTLGAIYNDYKMKVGDILEPAKMLDGIKDAFIAELGNDGYQIVSDSRDLVLNVQLLSATCDRGSNTQEARIRIRVTLFDKGTEVLNSVYEGDSKINFTMDFTGSDSLNDAIRKLVISFSKDLDRYIKT